MSTEDKLGEAMARAETVAAILRVETHPDYVRNYKMELGRLRQRIKNYRRILSRASCPS